MLPDEKVMTDLEYDFSNWEVAEDTDENPCITTFTALDFQKEYRGSFEFPEQENVGVLSGRSFWFDETPKMSEDDWNFFRSRLSGMCTPSRDALTTNYTA